MKKNVIITILCILLLGCQQRLERTNPLDPQNTLNDGQMYNLHGFVKTQSGLVLGGVKVSAGPSNYTTTAGNGEYNLSVPFGITPIHFECDWFISRDITANAPNFSSEFQNVILQEHLLFYDNFDSSATLMYPWSVVDYYGISSIESSVFYSSPKSCKLYSSNAAGDYARIEYMLPGSSQGFKISGKLRAEQNETGSFEMAIANIGNMDQTVLGFWYGGSLGVKYSTPVNNNQTSISTPLAAYTFYIFTIKAEKDTNMAEFNVFPAIGGSPIYSFTNKQIVPSGTPEFNKFVVRISYETPFSKTGYIDDITIMQK